MAIAAAPYPVDPSSIELRVLLVDDSREDALLTRKIIERSVPGHVQLTISVSRSLREAVLALQAEHFDCVLLDLNLFDGRGLGNIDVVRTAAPHVPVVVVSGVDDCLAIERARLHGAMAYVVKRPPSSSDDIFEVISQVLAGSPQAAAHG